MLRGIGFLRVALGEGWEVAGGVWGGKDPLGRDRGRWSDSWAIREGAASDFRGQQRSHSCDA